MMRELDLDLVRRPHWLRRISLVMLTVSLTFALFQAYQYRHLMEDLAIWEAKWQRLQKQNSKMAALPVQQNENWEQLHAEMKAANRVIEQLALPWDTLFREIETSMSEEVALLSIEPDMEKKEVRITAEAKSLTDMLAYMRQLRASSVFKDAHVVYHHVQQQDPQRPVRFLIAAQWVTTISGSSLASSSLARSN